MARRLSVGFTPDDTTDYTDATGSTTIDVVNRAVGSLILSPIPAQSVDVGQTLHLNLSPFASESGATTMNLTYSLGSDAPAGANIDPTTGALSWPLGTNQQIGTYPITVRVADNDSSQQVAATTFNVNVVDPGPAPTISGAIVSMKKGFSITLSFSQPVNPVSAANPNNYILTQPARSHTSKKKTSPPQPIRIGLSVSYNPATNQVTLKGPKKVKAGRGLTLTVVGAGPNGIAKLDDLHLAGSGGQPGTNYLASVTAKAVNRISAVAVNTIRRERPRNPRVSTLTPMSWPIPSPTRGPRGRARRLGAGRADEPVLAGDAELERGMMTVRADGGLDGLDERVPDPLDSPDDRSGR